MEDHLNVRTDSDREMDYLRGRNDATRSIMQHCLAQLYEGKEPKAERLLLERSEAIAMLRQVCEHYGDNDWPDSLHLADIIEKHLWRHLP